MERIAKLEAHMEVVRSDLSALKNDLRDVRERSIKLEERVSRLPTKGWAATSIIAVVGLITTIVTLVVTLAPKLQALFGVVKS